jgi:6-phosphofructokinase 1
VAAEGAQFSAEDFHNYVNDAEGTYESRLTAMGHIQRGGNPTAADRILATRLGSAAVEALADGEFGTMVGLQDGRARRVPLDEIVGRMRPLDPELYKMAGILAELPE